MRILYIHQYYATRRSSSGTRSYEQARAMQAAGHQVTVLTSSAQFRADEIPPGRGIIRRGRIDGIDVIVLDIPYDQRMSYSRRAWSFLRFMLWACRVVLRSDGVDLIYATSTPLTVGIPAMLGKLWRGMPYFFEVRDLWPDIPVALGIFRSGLIVSALRRLEVAIYRHARLIVAVNNDVAEAIRRKTHRRKNVIVVSNACDTGLFSPDRDGSAFRRQQGLEGKILCVHTGAMGPVNGLDAIIDAAVEMQDKTDVRFVFIGRGSEKTGLQKRVENEGLRNVLFIEPMPKDELADVLATADVGLMTVAPIPILEFNCANKFFDYLAAGLPVVLNYRGWQGRLLKKHECGLSSAQSDTNTFVQAIQQLTADAELRKTMSSRARKLAETDLNRKTIVKPLLSALEAFNSGRFG